MEYLDTDSVIILLVCITLIFSLGRFLWKARTEVVGWNFTYPIHVVIDIKRRNFEARFRFSVFIKNAKCIKNL